MARRRGKRRTRVENLKPRPVKGAEGRAVKGGLSKLAPGDGTGGSGGTGGGIGDKLG